MKYALLIDSENAKPQLDELFQEISKFGDTPIRYLIGDFTNSQSKQWVSICQKHAISCIQTMNFTKGKNSLDISLVIEGMKILYEKNYIDGIIIVASDSDYTPLCREWRSMGKDVIGIGRTDTPESYRASCTKFIYTENIYAKEKNNNSKTVLSLSKIKNFTTAILNENNGKCQISLVCESLLKAFPDFDVRSYGYSKSIDFFRNEFKELNITEDIKNTYFISFKDNKEEKPNNIKPKANNNNKKKNNSNNKMKVRVSREEIEDNLKL